MTARLWKAFFEDDVDNFCAVLGNATYISTTATAKGKASDRTTSGSYGASPGAHSVHRESRMPAGGGSKPRPGIALTRAAINLRDQHGLTLLHLIASSASDKASDFAARLLEVPFLDLYIQDAENGWTALHRALYFGNITIARAILDRDQQDAAGQNHYIGSQAGSLIRVKDREGNSPFDLFTASIAPRSISKPLGTTQISEMSEDDDGPAQGVSGDREDEEILDREVHPIINVDGDELFTFGSNQNLTLGLGDEDDRQFPERIVLKRPIRLVQRLVAEHREPSNRGLSLRLPSGAMMRDEDVPACVSLMSVTIQDIQMSKLHTAVLTTDPEANLHICGFGSGGRLGTGDESTRFQFVSVSGGALIGKKVINVALGQNHTVAISSLGEVITWGNNTYGQLGYATPSAQSDEDAKQLLPKQLFGLLKKERVIGAAASRVHTVVHTSHSLYTFGKNDGQLGLVDSDARSLAMQNIPRKIAASLFSSAIHSVTAIDHATVCLLETHEVWVFANYGYTKLSIDTETLASHFLRTSYSLTRYGNVTNHIVKVIAKRDTICALTSMGEVFTVSIKAGLDVTPTATSTTNPAKIRNALTAPIRVWSNAREHMRVHDVDVGQDGSIIICTAAGSVWRRISRTKLTAQRPQSSFDTRPRDYKFSRIPALTNINAVRASAYGAYAAVRRDCNVLKEQVVVEPSSLWRDLFPLLPFTGLAARADAECANPVPRFWVGSTNINDTAGYRRAVLTLPDLEAALKSLLSDMDPARSYQYDMGISTSSSDVIVPVHEFMLSGRSRVLRQALTTFRREYFFSITSVLTIEYGEDGRILMKLLDVDIITLYNLVLYIYTDTMADVWHHTRHSPKLAFQYRQIRVELMRLASALSMRSLESAARLMTEPKKVLQEDMEEAISDKTLFASADLELELDGPSTKAHGAILCQRCPFFRGLIEGRTGGGWLNTRKNAAAEPHELIKVDLTHIDTTIFQYIIRFIYADTDTSLFDDVKVTDIDEFIDLVLEVLSIANELMLERLSEVCQKVLARHVNTRNICSLLNAVAPCSVTSFKDAGLEYICLNMEAMLEGNLLSELDGDLMLELDAVTRDNQLAHQPISRSGRAEAELFEQYPELLDIMESNRCDKLESVSARAARTDRENLSIVSVKTGNSQHDHATTSLRVPGNRRGSSQQLQTPERSPEIQAKHSEANRSFSIGEAMGSSVDVAARRNDPEADLESTSEPGTLGKDLAYPSDRATSGDQQVVPRQPWSTSSLAPSKFTMQEIIAQASRARTSALSSAINNSPSSLKSTRMSQRERKRQNQEAFHKKSQPEAPTPVEQPVKQESKGSPWQVASRLPKSSMKDIIGSEVVAPPTLQRSNSSHQPAGPSHTLRQTVPGNVRQSSEPLQTEQNSSELRRASQGRTFNTPATPPRPTSSKSLSVSQMPSHAPSPPTPSIKIQSIRHTPLPSQHTDPDDSCFANFSISDIVSQQQLEKDAIKEAAAKRSLQEIQEEQAFQEWWDEESRKVQEEQQQQQAQNWTGDKAGKGTKIQRRRCAVSSRSRGRTQRSSDGQRSSSDVKTGGIPTQEAMNIGPSDKNVNMASKSFHGRGKSNNRHGENAGRGKASFGNA